MGNLYFEIIAFFYAIRHPEILSNFKKEFFADQTIRGVFDHVKKFVSQYRTEPTAEQLIEIVRLSGDDIRPELIQTLWNSSQNINQYSDDWLSSNVTGWGKWRSFYTGLENLVAYVQSLPTTPSFGLIDSYIDKAKSIFGEGSAYNTLATEGHDFFDLANHQQTALNTRTSGYNFIDLCLNGGLSNKSLVVFMGSPKVGKSMWLCNMAAKSVKNGYNTLYISLEMSYQLVMQRIGANMYNININEYNEVSKNLDELQKRVAAAKMDNFGQHYGTFIVEEFPTSTATASDIENFALALEQKYSTPERPFKFHNIIIDYINIMKDQKNPNSENTYQKIKSICEDTRACAQRNDWCIISVTQTNRGGMDASDLNMSNVSESAGLIATVDALFGIIRTPVMMADGCYYLKAIALRNSSHMGDKKKFNFDPHFLRIDEDMTEDIIPENMEIPLAMKSATQNAVAKAVRGNTANPSQLPPTSAPFIPGSIPVTSTSPQLVLTEQQLAGTALFGSL